MIVSVLDRLESLPPTRAMWGRIALLSLGGFFEFYDLFLAGYIAPGLTKAHILAPTGGLVGSVAGFIAVFFAGLFVGTALFGTLADRLGRRAVFTVSLLWYSASAVMMALQTDALGLDIWRFIAGIGIGVELVTIDTYIAELAPRQVRGRAFAFSNVLQFLAIPLVALLATLLVPNAPFGIAGWRWVVLAGAAGALIVWWVRLGVPESPRWLATHGRTEEAAFIVAAWEAEAVREGKSLTPHASKDTDAKPGRFAEIWQPPYRRRALMLIAFNLFQAAGYYGFASWAPTLLIAQGIEVTRSLAYTVIMALAAPIGPLLGLAFTDRVERKWIIVAAALGIAAAGLGFAAARAAATVIACGFVLTLANNILSYAYHGYQPELFPTRIRARAVGFVYSFSRLATMASAFVIAALLARFGAPGVFVFIAGCMAVVAGVIALFGPATRGLPLETISR
jgi:putative MFS transporter